MNFSLQRVVLSEFIAWILIACVALYILFPLNKSLRLGMDLKGGTYLTLTVQTDKAVEIELIHKMQLIESALKKAHRPQPVSKTVVGNVLQLSFTNQNVANEVFVFIKDIVKGLEYSLDQSTITFSFPSKEVDRIGYDARSRNMEVLAMRLDKIGVSETPISAQGDKNIVVEMPDVFDTAQVKAMLGTVAQLELKLIDRTARSREDLLYDLDEIVPGDKQIVVGKSDDNEVYLVDKYAELTGSYISNAKGDINAQTGEPFVQFELTPEGGEKFQELVRNNVGKRLAITLDDVVISSPSIGPDALKITTSGSIQGKGMTPEGCQELALLLKSGAFVAPVVFAEERQVGPLLGAESIRQGLLSCLLSLGLLFVFSVLWYKWCGVAAVMALVLNLIFILLGMSWIGATLTLPGIGGMVLTIGMAIDASILIFERVKELIADGQSPIQAIRGGFSGATAVILDANITHFIVGMVLYYFGAGPIKGFAVTLILGIVATLLTGVFFLKSIFNFVFNNFQVRKLSI